MSSRADGVSRRALLGRAALLIGGASPLAAALVAQDDAGALRDPTVAGRPRTATGAGDNDETIKRIEQQLKCTCGCNLDIFTCRTTDFSCTYSPELHREVLALHEGGRTPQEVIDAFVAKYGERVLMAPKPVDFNLVGYLLPGAAVLAGGAALAWVIGRRGQRGGRAGGPGGGETAAGVLPSATSEELDRLRRDLAEVED